jgi:hypothetical protein
MMGEDLRLPKTYPGPCFCGAIPYLDSMVNQGLGFPFYFCETPGSQQSHDHLACKRQLLCGR